MTAIAWVLFAAFCCALFLLVVVCATNSEVIAQNQRLRNRLAATERDLELASPNGRYQ